MKNYTLNPHVAEVERSFMQKVYVWMSSALFVSGFIAYYLASYQAELLFSLLKNPAVFYGILIGQVGIAIALGGFSRKMNMATSLVFFYLYAISIGITFAGLFFVYTLGSIATTFFITAGTFSFMAIYGYTTKADLSTMGNIAFMGLIGVIIASLVNIFLKNDSFQLIISFIGVLVFVALTAYDTQKLKEIAHNADLNQESGQKIALLGAFSLYLDFINLFLYLLRFFGNNRD
ncbi:MAG: Bax inhibitor-1/YccA family protein [Candidatus Gracilibacteria bacterium]|jgi:FtsH-binding integral membrane protein|nr:Bax inhibitor-1/YccA family protein [Candidatus Gracilibacteria bacterium]